MVFEDSAIDGTNVTSLSTGFSSAPINADQSVEMDNVGDDSNYPKQNAHRHHILRTQSSWSSGIGRFQSHVV